MDPALFELYTKISLLTVCCCYYAGEGGGKFHQERDRGRSQMITELHKQGIPLSVRSLMYVNTNDVMP